MRYYDLGTPERSYSREFGSEVCPGKALQGPAWLQCEPKAGDSFSGELLGIGAWVGLKRAWLGHLE